MYYFKTKMTSRVFIVVTNNIDTDASSSFLECVNKILSVL
jgi:hypothetical protein